MGSMNVYDDGSQSWGSIGSGFASAIMNAPAKAAAQQHMIETIKDQRIKRAREEEQYQAAQGSIAAFSDTLQKEVAPVTTIGPFTGDLSDPGTTAGLPTAQFIDPRQQAQLDAYNKMSTAAFRQNALAGKPESYGSLNALATVGGAGVPTDPSERNRLNFLANQKFMTDAERALPTAHNMVIKGPNDEIIDQFSTRNGVTTEDGRRLVDIRAKLTPDQRILAAGAATTTAPNPLENASKAIERLNVLRREIGPDGPTPEQALQVQQLVDVAYKPTRKVETIGERPVVLAVPDNPVPPWVTNMLPRTPTTSSVSTTVPAPVAAGAFNAADIADPSKLNAPLPAQPQGPLVSDPNVARIVEERPGSSVELRKEFQQAPAYKKYTGSISDYNNVVRAATEGEPNNTTDLNIIYSIAKIFDPDSAVKDGELKLPNATGSIAQQLSSLYTRLLSDRGMMDAETRAHLVSEATRRVNEYKESMNVTNTQYADLARRIGVPPEAVITQVPPMLPYNEADALRAGGGTARGPAAPAPAVPTAPPPRPRF